MPTLTKSTVLFLLGISYCVHAAADVQQQAQQEQGKWMIVNLWAQWCKPCREEIPALNRLSDMLASSQIEVLGINYDGIEGAELDDAINSLNIRFPQMDARQQASINLKMPAALPATYIVSPTGEVKVSLIGKQNLESIFAAMEHVNPKFKVNELINNERMVTP